MSGDSSMMGSYGQGISFDDYKKPKKNKEETIVGTTRKGLDVSKEEKKYKKSKPKKVIVEPDPVDQAVGASSDSSSVDISSPRSYKTNIQGEKQKYIIVDDKPKKVVSSQSIKQEQQQNLKTIKQQEEQINPEEKYILGSNVPELGDKGTVVTGTRLKRYYQNQYNYYNNLYQKNEIQQGEYLVDKDQYYFFPRQLQYLYRYGEQEQSKKLIQSINSEEYEKSYLGTYESLSEEEKIGYNLLKFYPGDIQNLSSLTNEEKKDILNRYMSSSEWKKYIQSDKGQKQRTATAQSIHEKKVTKDTTYKFSIPLVGTVDTGIKQPKGWGKLNVSSIAIYDYTSAEKQIAKKKLFSTPSKADEEIFKNLGLRTRMIQSYTESGVSAALFPVTLTQLGVKTLTGKGSNIFKRIQTGKTVLLPDVSKKLSENKITPTQGVISGGIGEGAERLGFGKSNYFKTVKKYPLSSGAASWGEFTGLYIGGKAVHTTKVSTVKALGVGRSKVLKYTGVNLPGYTNFAKYSPINLYRTAKYKTIRYTKPEDVFQTKALPNQLSFAPGRTSSERIKSLFKAFEKSKGKTIYGEDIYTGVHSSTNPWYKPFVWMRKGRESPGVSFAPLGEGSPRFLRTGGYFNYSSKLSIFPKIKLRATPMLHFKNIKKIPMHLTKKYKYANKFIKDSGSGVYVAPKMYKSGGEYEVIARGFARRLGLRYYTKIEGINIPLPEFTMSKFSPSIISKTKNVIVSGLTSSYNSPASIPLINPGYIASNISSKIGSVSTRVNKKISIPVSKTYISNKPVSTNVVSTNIQTSSLSYMSTSVKNSIVSSSKSIGTVSSSLNKNISVSTPKKSPTSFSKSSVNVSSTPNKNISSSSSGSNISLSSIPSFSSSKTMTSKKPAILFPSTNSQKPETQEGYHVYVKSRHYVKGKPSGSKKFRKLTHKSLSYNDAKNLLGSALDRSIAQTGYIKPSGEPAKQLKKKLPSKWKGISFKFRKKDNKYVERRPYAIDTRGEKQELDVFRWYQGLPKQESKVQSMRSFEIDMYGFDKMNSNLNKKFRRLRF